MKKAFRLISAILLATWFAGQTMAAATKPVRVFILAGQSNMEGHGFIAADPKRRQGIGCAFL